MAHALHPQTLYAWLEEYGMAWLAEQGIWALVDEEAAHQAQDIGWLDAWLDESNRRWWAEQLADIKGFNTEVEEWNEGEARPRRGSGNR